MPLYCVWQGVYLISTGGNPWSISEANSIQIKWPWRILSYEQHDWTHWQVIHYSTNAHNDIPRLFYEFLSQSLWTPLPLEEKHENASSDDQYCQKSEDKMEPPFVKFLIVPSFHYCFSSFFSERRWRATCQRYLFYYSIDYRIPRQLSLLKPCLSSSVCLLLKIVVQPW